MKNVSKKELAEISQEKKATLKGSHFESELPKILPIFFIGLIRIYQNSLRFVFPSSCRFYPSCSEYSIEALRKYGIFKGSWLSARRLVRCNPFNPGGYDPLI